MHYSVLIVDDELELSEYTSKYFNMSGVSATYVTDKQAALDFFTDNTCSLILLDINLGEDSGFELCQMIRAKMNVPIFFISARSAEDDMLLALSIGGDDYICKPYSLGVLLAKVKAALKRYEAAAKAEEQEDGSETSDPENEGASSDGTDGKTARASLVRLGNATVDLSRAIVIRNGGKTPLKAMEFRLLVYMLNNRNRIIKKEEFFEKIWGTEFVGDVTLNVHIRHLREKIEDDPSNPAFIKTVWGTGFILEDQP
ncbi:MAG: response regulator transcription factor [Clostridiales bacterium]|nr:response regulator transcription factor [Clostridiales bacterium]